MLYALGRSYQAQADAVEDGSQQNLRWRAATLYRSARFISPNNALASNQLGFVLLQMDRPVDAREALVASINAFPSLAAYENLVEASRRLGDTGTSNWAMQQALALKGATAAPQGIPAFIEVDPRTFAAMSPYTIGPPPQSQNGVAQPYRTAGLSAPPNN
jgi:Tfp pilus assembly protein PilF